MTAQTKPPSSSQAASRHPVPPAPVHPLAALVTFLLDNLFGLVEIGDPFLLIFTCLGVGALCMITTMLIQHYLARDGWGASTAKALVMGIIAGVPFQVAGTAVGASLLAWAGLHEWVTRPAASARPEPSPAADKVVDAEFKDVK